MIPYGDDKTIADPDPLWRRVPPAMVVFDDNLGRKRPSSSAFSNGRGETPMSVILGRELLQSGRPAHALVCGRKTRGIQSRLAKMSTWVISPGM